MTYNVFGGMSNLTQSNPEMQRVLKKLAHTHRQTNITIRLHADNRRPAGEMTGKHIASFNGGGKKNYFTFIWEVILFCAKNIQYMSSTITQHRSQMFRIYIKKKNFRLFIY